jgi:exonuclease III
LANWRDVEDRKRISAASQRPIDKVPLLAVEMLEHGVEICCISEVRRGNEEFVREGFKFFCSGYPDDRKIHGVGVIVDVTVISGEIECHRVSPRIMWIGGVFKGVKMAIISVYAPTNVSSQMIQDAFYDELARTHVDVARKYSEVCICGDFNARIGHRDDQTWKNVVYHNCNKRMLSTGIG